MEVVMDKKPKSKEDWDAEWVDRTLQYLLIENIREEAKERLIEESLADVDYAGYKKRYFDFLSDHSEAVKKLEDVSPPESPDLDL
jgi:hypothetical protein